MQLFVVSGGWFVGTYMMLMFLAPLLNAGVDSVVGQGRRFAYDIWLVLACGVLLQWFSLHGMSGIYAWGEHGGCSLSMMVFVYVTARLVRLAELRFGLHMLCFVASLFVLGVLIFGGVGVLINKGDFLRISWKTSYDAPHVWTLSIMIVMIVVTRLRVNQTIGRFAGFVAPSVLGVYLFHDTTSFGRPMICALESYLLESTGWSPFVMVILTTFAVFFLALTVDVIRRTLVWLAKRTMCELC